MPDIDIWSRLRATTPARIGLGRTGDALRVTDLLDFQMAHARARDAVHDKLDTAALVEVLPPPTIIVRSAAPDRATYLRRPDLGRALDPACALERGSWDAVFVLADGLSSVACARHGPPLLRACLDRLPGWRIAPIVVATQARVALGDQIGERLGAEIVVMLIGERPGLSSADSLGCYLTYAPRTGRRDSERNCVSNIHANGLSYTDAADAIAWLMMQARSRQLTGIALKDDRDWAPAITDSP
jgi:ethanolamine ammonia-lyase small subunit